MCALERSARGGVLVCVLPSAWTPGKPSGFSSTNRRLCPKSVRVGRSGPTSPLAPGALLPIAPGGLLFPRWAVRFPTVSVPSVNSGAAFCGHGGNQGPAAPGAEAGSGGFFLRARPRSLSFLSCARRRAWPGFRRRRGQGGGVGFIEQILVLGLAGCVSLWRSHLSRLSHAHFRDIWGPRRVLCVGSRAGRHSTRCRT